MAGEWPGTGDNPDADKNFWEPRDRLDGSVRSPDERDDPGEDEDEDENCCPYCGGGLVHSWGGWGCTKCSAWYCCTRRTWFEKGRP